jgi:hypothetical protein
MNTIINVRDFTERLSNCPLSRTQLYAVSKEYLYIVG